ncbi:hypothetical protein Tco_1408136, partial [Tanacetum coccineum]
MEIFPESTSNSSAVVSVLDVSALDKLHFELENLSRRFIHESNPNDAGTEDESSATLMLKIFLKDNKIIKTKIIKEDCYPASKTAVDANDESVSDLDVITGDVTLNLHRIMLNSVETAGRVSDGHAYIERDMEKLLVMVREVEAKCDAVEVKMREALEMQIVAKYNA